MSLQVRDLLNILGCHQDSLWLCKALFEVIICHPFKNQKMVCPFDALANRNPRVLQNIGRNLVLVHRSSDINVVVLFSV